MQEVARFNGVLLCQKLGEGRKKFIAVDADTGEKMGEWFIGDVEYAFECGVNAVALTLMVGREVTEAGGEYITITDYNQDPPKVLYSFWYDSRQRINKRPKHNGGKKPYVVLFPDKLDMLESAEAGTLIKLAQKVDWETGILVDKRKKQPLDFAALLKIAGCAKATLSKRLHGLRKAGALTAGPDGSYIISRDFVRKG